MKKALLVGINNYRNPSASLKGCVNDVSDVRGVLLDSGFSPEDIRVLCDARATKANIVSRLKWLVSEVREGDVAVFHYSGHGSQVADRNGDEVNDHLDEVLVPYDFEEHWDDPLSDDVISGILKKVNPKAKIVCIVDACHSGTITRGFIDMFFRWGYRKDKFLPPPFDITCRAMGRELPTRKVASGLVWKSGGCSGDPNVHLADNNVTLLSGCRDDQTSADAYLGGRYRGALTAALCKSISKGDKVSWETCHQRILGFLQSEGFDQIPQLTISKDGLTEVGLF